MLRAMSAPACRLVLRAATCTAGLWLAALTSLAAPAGPDDPVQRLLAERGLIKANATPAEASLARQVRDRAAEMVRTAMNFIGVPYRRGGDSIDSGFDCSGFTRHVFETSLGLALPRRSHEQARAPGLQTIKREALQPGDLVFFNTLKRSFSHVGIYIGDDKFIHSPRSGAQVRVEDMRLAYWSRRYNGARRAGTLDEMASNDSQTLTTKSERLPLASVEPRAAPSAMHTEQWGSTPVAPPR